MEYTDIILKTMKKLDQEGKHKPYTTIFEAIPIYYNKIQSLKPWMSDRRCKNQIWHEKNLKGNGGIYRKVGQNWQLWLRGGGNLDGCDTVSRFSSLSFGSTVNSCLRIYNRRNNILIIILKYLWYLKIS